MMMCALLYSLDKCMQTLITKKCSPFNQHRNAVKLSTFSSFTCSLTYCIVTLPFRRFRELPCHPIIYDVLRSCEVNERKSHLAFHFITFTSLKILTMHLKLKRSDKHEFDEPAPYLKHNRCHCQTGSTITLLLSTISIFRHRHTLYSHSTMYCVRT